MRFRTGPVLAGDTSLLPAWRQGRRRSLPFGVAGWAAAVLGLLGSYGADTLALQAAACVVGAAGIAGVVIAAVTR